MNPSCQTTGSKTLEFKVFSTHVGSMVQDVLPNNLPQNTADYSVFHPKCKPWGNASFHTSSSKTLQFTVFPPKCKQWKNPSCQTTGSKTLELTVFSTHAGSMVQDFLPDGLLQNTGICGVFHSCWFNGSRALPGQHVPNAVNCSVCTRFETMVPAVLRNNLPTNTANYSAFRP